jgi:chitinase
MNTFYLKDLHGSWESFTGHHSALYPRANENSEQKQLNDDFAVKYWMQLGAPSSKLHLGIPTYGRSFKIGASTALGASSSGPGLTGTVENFYFCLFVCFFCSCIFFCLFFKFTREGGFVSYYEVCQYLANGYTKVFDNEQQIPYAYKSGDWVGYEDVQSAKIKVCIFFFHFESSNNEFLFQLFFKYRVNMLLQTIWLVSCFGYELSLFFSSGT